jgi:hypothetical protein
MPSIILSDNGVSSGSAGLKSTAGNDGVLQLQTTTAGGTATTAVTLDTSQNVLVGMASYGVTNAGVSLSPTASSSFYVAGGTAVTIGRGTSDGTAVQFNRSGTNVGTIAVATTGLTMTGTNGITFTAAQTASTNANTLDDYEEGTWTPTWYGSATFGTPSGSASGTYTKIGNMVTVFASFTAINLTGATGNLYVGGLPFTQASGGQGVCYWEGITPTYAKATVTGSGLMVSSVGGNAVAFKPSITTLWDNYLLASSTFNGGGGSTYGYFTLTYFV